MALRAIAFVKNLKSVDLTDLEVHFDFSVAGAEVPNQQTTVPIGGDEADIRAAIGAAVADYCVTNQISTFDPGDTVTVFVPTRAVVTP